MSLHNNYFFGTVKTLHESRESAGVGPIGPSLSISPRFLSGFTQMAGGDKRGGCQNAELSSKLERLVIAPPKEGPASAGRRQSKAKRLPGGVALGEVANLFTCSIDVSKLSGVRAVVASLVSSLRSSSSTAGAGGIGGLGGGGSCKLPFKPKRYIFHAERPNWKSDIRWVSADDPHTFGLFQVRIY